MIPAASGADEKSHPQRQHQQQQQNQIIQNSPFIDDYHSDWTGNEEPTNEENEYTSDQSIEGQSLIDDINTIDK